MVYIAAGILTIMELTKYIMAFKYVFIMEMRINFKKIIMLFGSTLVIQEFIFLNYDDSWQLLIILVFGLLIPLLLVKGKILEKIAQYIIIVSSVSLVDIFGSFGVVYILSLTNFDINHVISKVIQNSVSIIILFILKFVGKKWRYEKVVIATWQYFIITVGLFSSLLVIAGIQEVLNDGGFTRKGWMFWYFFNACASVMYIMLCLYQIIIYNRGERYRKKNHSYEEFMKLQENQINNILRNDKEQRRFRHDMRAHLMVIREYCNVQNYIELRNYLNNIEKNSGLYEMKKYTGNTAVDAVIEDIAQRAKEYDIFIKWNGELYISEDIELYDICTLFSNVLNNAVEACEKVIIPSEVEVDVYNYNKKSFIEVKNPIFEPVDINNNHMNTTKLDKENHGYGNYNIKKVVEKYGGILKYSCDDCYFSVEIII